MFSIDFSCDEFNIIVEAEDAGDEQESLGHVDQFFAADDSGLFRTFFCSRIFSPCLSV